MHTDAVQDDGPVGSGAEVTSAGNSRMLTIVETDMHVMVLVCAHRCCARMAGEVGQVPWDK